MGPGIGDRKRQLVIAWKGIQLLITFADPLLGDPALPKKIVSARRRNQHARRVRYPSFATLPPQDKIFAFVPAASASWMLPLRL